MKLSSDLVSQFAKETNQKPDKPKETILYGTTSIVGGQPFVKLDGAEVLTPVTTTVTVKDGERVSVNIENHRAVITGSISAPATSEDDLSDLYEMVGNYQENTIVSYVPYYMSSASSTDAPTCDAELTGWSTTVERVDGEYLWMITVLTHMDGTSNHTEPVCISGSNGADGASGADGVGISTVTHIYRRYTKSQPSLPSSSGAVFSVSDTDNWTTAVPTITPSYKYVWLSTMVVLTNGTTTFSTPVISTDLGYYANFQEKIERSLYAGTTYLGVDYVISPNIGGGYLDILGGGNRVVIDPADVDPSNDKSYVLFAQSNGETVFSVDRYGNAVFNGEINASAGTIGGWTITENRIEKYDPTVYYGRRSGMQAIMTEGGGYSAFYAGCSTEPGGTIADLEFTNFYVTQSGALYSMNATIGGSIRMIDEGTYNRSEFNIDGKDLFLQFSGGSLCMNKDLEVYGSANINDRLEGYQVCCGEFFYGRDPSENLKRLIGISSGGNVSINPDKLGDVYIRAASDGYINFGDGTNTIKGIKLNGQVVSLSGGSGSTITSTNQLTQNYTTSSASGYGKGSRLITFKGISDGDYTGATAEYVQNYCQNYTEANCAAKSHSHSGYASSSHSHTRLTNLTMDNNLRVINQLKNDYANNNATTGGSYTRISGNIFYKHGSSSKRYKHDIQDLTDDALAPERLYDLPVRQFIYNLDYLIEGDQRYNTLVPGFVAEEVDEVYPIAATKNEDGVEDWEHRFLIPPMLALIQKQHLEIKQLESRITTLEQR